ncbi:hypothetical protein JHK87_009535 [Glycine soja]|nr:hypothetical protein JHK87_009535 [Glycine soja]
MDGFNNKDASGNGNINEMEFYAICQSIHVATDWCGIQTAYNQSVEKFFWVGARKRNKTIVVEEYVENTVTEAQGKEVFFGG